MPPYVSTIRSRRSGRHCSATSAVRRSLVTARSSLLRVAGSRSMQRRSWRSLSHRCSRPAIPTIRNGTVVDPYDPDLPGSRQSPTFFTVGNARLEPERTRSYNLGIVLSPRRDTSLSVDWYRLELDNLIGTNNTTTIVAENDPANVLRDERGKLLAVYNRYQNLTELETSGFDVELRHLWRAPLGDV